MEFFGDYGRNMRSRHPLFYIFPHGLLNKNANPVTRAQPAAMMERQTLTGNDSRKDRKGAKKNQRFESKGLQIGKSEFRPLAIFAFLREILFSTRTRP